MTHYAVAQINIHEPEAYGRYMAGFMPVLAQYGGTLLAADNAPVVAEGDWPYQKLVLIAFEDAPALGRWAGSPEYQAIAVDRKAGAAGVFLMVQGV
jgi:uncharacterized protein (DUF1330 family)